MLPELGYGPVNQYLPPRAVPVVPPATRPARGLADLVRDWAAGVFGDR